MSDKITNFDRAAICRDAWNRAYAAAIEAAEPVRSHIGAAMRAAWAEFRQDRVGWRARVTTSAEYDESFGQQMRRQARERLRGLLASRCMSTVLSAHDTMRIVLEEQIAYCDAAIARMRAQIDQAVSIHGLIKFNDRNDDQIDDLFRKRCDLRNDLRALDLGGIVLPPPRQHADPIVAGRLRALRAYDNGLTAEIEKFATLAKELRKRPNDPDCLDATNRLKRLWDDREGLRAKICTAESTANEQAARSAQLDLIDWLTAQVAVTSQATRSHKSPASALMVDLTTAEGLASLLVGRAAKLQWPGIEFKYTITAVHRWKAPNCNRVRDYIHLETSDPRRDDRKGPVKIYIERIGANRGPHLETRAGLARWSYGSLCGSGIRQRSADHLVRELLEPLI